MDRIIIPTGIAINDSGKSLRIFFILNGIRCRETINLPPTKSNVKYVANLRSEILNKIARGTFNYAEFFPNSRLAIKSGIIKPNKNIRCKQLLEKQLSYYEKLTANGHLSPSTFIAYNKIIKNILIPQLGSYFIQNLTASVIRQWITNFTDVTYKTIKNILIPLKQTLDDALNDELIAVNPINSMALDKLVKTVGKKSEFEVNPFTAAEKELIISAAVEGQIKNLIHFGFWSGLRTSELIALKWDDIDFDRKIAYIHEAKVANIEKCTKTKAGTRKLVLLPEAITALSFQLCCNRHSKYVFHNPNTDKPWSNSSKVSDVWRKLLLTLSIPYRNCYQMRHTYASTLLSNGENILWVAKQMGHANISTLIKHYARWIPNDNNSYDYSFAGKY